MEQIRIAAWSWRPIRKWMDVRATINVDSWLAQRMRCSLHGDSGGLLASLPTYSDLTKGWVTQTCRKPLKLFTRWKSDSKSESKWVQKVENFSLAVAPCDPPDRQLLRNCLRPYLVRIRARLQPCRKNAIKQTFPCAAGPRAAAPGKLGVPSTRGFRVLGWKPGFGLLGTQCSGAQTKKIRSDRKDNSARLRMPTASNGIIC
jgi:hypothetical protein